MHADCDLAAVVYDPPAPGFPHMAVLFDGERAVIAVQPVESIDAGETALEGAIHALQDELDVLRADARRAFTVSAGHA